MKMTLIYISSNFQELIVLSVSTHEVILFSLQNYIRRLLIRSQSYKTNFRLYSEMILV